MREGSYVRSEIKYNIDNAIQAQMFHSDESQWPILLELQSRLYEQFDILD